MEEARTPSRLLCATWRGLFLAAAAGALGAWALLPGGFPLDHPRFFANRVLPGLLLVTALLGLLARLLRPGHGRAEALERGAAFALTAFTLAGPLAGLVVFPHSGARLLLPALVPGALLAAAWWLRFRRRPRGVIALPAALLALAAVTAQRAPEADTRPAGTAPVELRLDPRLPGRIGLADGLTVYAAEGAVRARLGPLQVYVEPLLRWFDASPDRCWTIFHPEGRAADALTLRGAQQARMVAPSLPTVAFPRLLRGGQRGEGWLRLDYGGGAARRLEVRALEAGVALAASSVLEEELYSHLNSFTTIEIRGHRRLELVFSPCPTTPIAVLPSDYPFGRPCRAAFLDAGGDLVIVEASSGEKGPFRELARGPLGEDSLTIFLHDGGLEVGRIVLYDWARQAGRTLSPSAGWGLPVNAIELDRSGESERAPCRVYITLAATSLGRGWDAVGHRTGVYSNRIRLE